MSSKKVFILFSPVLDISDTKLKNAKCRYFKFAKDAKEFSKNFKVDILFKYVNVQVENFLKIVEEDNDNEIFVLQEIAPYKEYIYPIYNYCVKKDYELFFVVSKQLKKIHKTKALEKYLQKSLNDFIKKESINDDTYNEAFLNEITSGIAFSGRLISNQEDLKNNPKLKILYC